MQAPIGLVCRFAMSVRRYQFGTPISWQAEALAVGYLQSLLARHVEGARHECVEHASN